MELKEITVGIFLVKQLSEGRWRVNNSLTQFVHVTYGTEADVVAQLEIQSKAWKDKFDRTAANKSKKGSAWRQKTSAEFAEAKANRESLNS